MIVFFRNHKDWWHVLLYWMRRFPMDTSLQWLWNWVANLRLLFVLKKTGGWKPVSLVQVTRGNLCLPLEPLCLAHHHVSWCSPGEAGNNEFDLLEVYLTVCEDQLQFVQPNHKVSLSQLVSGSGRNFGDRSLLMFTSELPEPSLVHLLAPPPVTVVISALAVAQRGSLA